MSFFRHSITSWSQAALGIPSSWTNSLMSICAATVVWAMEVEVTRQRYLMEAGSSQWPTRQDSRRQTLVINRRSHSSPTGIPCPVSAGMVFSADWQAECVVNQSGYLSENLVGRTTTAQVLLRGQHPRLLWEGQLDGPLEQVLPLERIACVMVGLR